MPAGELQRWAHKNSMISRYIIASGIIAIAASSCEHSKNSIYYGPSIVANAAINNGIRFEFKVGKKLFNISEPIIVYCIATNPNDHNVVLTPILIKSSLCDFKIWDNEIPLTYKVNIPINNGAISINISAKESILWAKENIYDSVEGWGFISSNPMIGKHIMTFGTGNSIEFEVHK